MKRTKLNNAASRVDESSFEQFYGDYSQDWEGRARRLQARRWRKLKQQLL